MLDQALGKFLTLPTPFCAARPNVEFLVALAEDVRENEPAARLTDSDGDGSTDSNGPAAPMFVSTGMADISDDVAIERLKHGLDCLRGYHESIDELLLPDLMSPLILQFVAVAATVSGLVLNNTLDAPLLHH